MRSQDGTGIKNIRGRLAALGTGSLVLLRNKPSGIVAKLMLKVEEQGFAMLSVLIVDNEKPARLRAACAAEALDRIRKLKKVSPAPAAPSAP